MTGWFHVQHCEPSVGVAQQVRAPGCGPGGRGFKSPRSPQLRCRGEIPDTVKRHMAETPNRRSPTGPAGGQKPRPSASTNPSVRPRFDAGAGGPDNGVVASGAHQTPGGAQQRQHILNTALSLMAQRGVDGTSMRELAAAAGLNVASLYHYFPSKRDLLVAVLAEQGFIDEVTATPRPSLTRDPANQLADLLDDMLQSMLEVEDFIRLMLGEVIRGEETANAVGEDLFSATQESLERWLMDSQPAMTVNAGAPAVARVLRAMLIGIFFEHVAGVLDDDGDPAAAFRKRAEEAADVLRARP